MSDELTSKEEWYLAVVFTMHGSRAAAPICSLPITVPEVKTFLRDFCLARRRSVLMLRKHTWLTTADIDDHFARLCAMAEIERPFTAAARFILTFTARGAARQRLLDHLLSIKHDMEGLLDGSE